MLTKVETMLDFLAEFKSSHKTVYYKNVSTFEDTFTVSEN